MTIRQNNNCTERQVDRQADGQIEIQTNRRKNKQTEGPIDKKK